MKTLFLFLSVTYAFSAFAVEQLSMPYEINTKESIVEIQGIKYRQIEYKNEKYYLRLLDPGVTPKEIDLKCDRDNHAATDNLVHISTIFTKRSSLFIEGLRSACLKDERGQKTHYLDPVIQIGFRLEDSSKSVLKNRKIYLDPLNKGVGASAEW